MVPMYIETPYLRPYRTRQNIELFSRILCVPLRAKSDIRSIFKLREQYVSFSELMNAVCFTIDSCGSGELDSCLSQER